MKLTRTKKVLIGLLVGAVPYTANMVYRLSNVARGAYTLDISRRFLDDNKTEYDRFVEMVELGEQLSDQRVESPRKVVRSDDKKEKAKSFIRYYERINDLTNLMESKMESEKRKAFLIF
jgi:hypothetical protein